ncbi:DUF6082 family protein [Streptomyces sp. NPDC002896]|uniref:DUF6082 family protein n=1 Tax=Streptomyces sp. NPDC002896 TaxID=3154438 RepID=UPI0033221F77
MATQKLGIRGLGPAAAVLALAAAGTLARLAAQQRRYDALNQQHRLNFELLCKAMSDPALATVLDTYDSEVPADVQRQYLFANAMYINSIHSHRIGALSRAELYGHLRVMCQNRVFRDYWEATRHHRASLPGFSDEAELGQMMDKLIRDQEDADTEQWWVVGELPNE